MAASDSLSDVLLMAILSMLCNVADYQRCEYVCKRWRTASRLSRPTQLDLSPHKGEGWPVDNQQAVVKWLQYKLSARLLEDLQHISINGNDPHQEVAYALPMLFGCTSVSSVRLQQCPEVRLEWLPATVTHLQIKGPLGWNCKSSALTTAFPRLQDLIIDNLFMDIMTINRPFLHLMSLKIQAFGQVSPLILDRSLVHIFPRLQDIEYDARGLLRLNYTEAVVGIPTLKKATLTTSTMNEQKVRKMVEHRTDIVLTINVRE